MHTVTYGNLEFHLGMHPIVAKYFKQQYITLNAIIPGKTRHNLPEHPLVQNFFGERTGLVVRASDSGSGDPGSILGRVGVLFP